MQKIRWFLLIVAIVLALAMAFQNNEPAKVRLLWLEQSMPLSVLMLSTTAIGFLLGALMTALMLRRRGRVAAERKAKKAAPPSNAAKKPANESPGTSGI